MKRKEIISKKNSLNIYLKQNNIPIPSTTKKYIDNLSSQRMVCLLCNEKLFDFEIYNCMYCFNIYHLKCVLNNLKKLKISGFSRFTFDCECYNQVMFDKILKYNCYCGKYYEAEKINDPNFNPNLIIHGCGLSCNFLICKHLKCQLPCHPGPHQSCKEKECFQDLDNLEKNLDKIVKDGKLMQIFYYRIIF